MSLENIVIQIPRRCHRLERRAARELQKYIRRLFGFEARISPDLPKRGHAFSLGTPDSHPEFDDIHIDPQGFKIASRHWGNVHICNVIGGSPEAVQWGIYALIEQWGVHYLVHRDVLPAAPAATIRLANGIEIELGSDLRAFDLLAGRLLDGSAEGKERRC